MFTTPPVSCVTCYMSGVRCQVTPLRCKLFCKTNNKYINIDLYIYIFTQMKLQSGGGGASRWRVCYQRGLPNLVSRVLLISITCPLCSSPPMERCICRQLESTTSRHHIALHLLKMSFQICYSSEHINYTTNKLVWFFVLFTGINTKHQIKNM